MQDLRVGSSVMARHPFSNEMEEGVVLRIRRREEYGGRGPFYLIRFNDLDKTDAGPRIIRRWHLKEDLKVIE